MTLKVSNSKIKTFRHCKMQYDYKYIQKLRPRRKAPPLVRGTVIHNMLEAQIQGKNPWAAYSKDKRSYKKLFKEERAEYDQMMSDIRQLMKGYFIYYKDDPIEYTKLGDRYSEYYFDVPLVKGINIVGYLDSAGKKDGFNWLVEHKSHKQLPERGDMKAADTQGVIYTWVMPQLGLGEPDGVCWDYIKMKTPTKPALLKDGTLTKKKNIDTLWPTYLKEIHKHNLDPADYQDMKEQLLPKYSEFFVRNYIPVNSHTVEQVLEDVKHTAKEIQKVGGVDKTRNLSWQCERCDYYSLCHTELRGLDTDFIKDVHFTVNEGRK